MHSNGEPATIWKACSVAAMMIAVGGCATVSDKERQEQAAWDGCINAAIAERANADLPAQTLYFEVTYQCRASFPDWDKAGHSRRGRKLLTELYSRLVM